MALSLFAAEALVGEYLKGRVLGDSLRRAVVHTVEARLVDGVVPVLDKQLRQHIDSHATEQRPGSALQ